MLSRSRRLLARLLIVCALCATPIVATGCGGNSGIPGVIAHHILDKIAPGHAKLIDKAFCVYHVTKLFRDIKGHHAIYGAFNLYEAIKNCKAGFSQ